MKKMFIAALTALALYSCDKDEPATGTPDPKPDTHGATVTMTFTDETPTRAFFARPPKRGRNPCPRSPCTCSTPKAT